MLDAAKQRMMEEKSKLTERRNCHAEMVSIMSTLYAKLLIVIGLAVPITASVTERVPASLNQVTDNSLERKKKRIDLLSVENRTTTTTMMMMERRRLFVRVSICICTWSAWHS